MKCSVVQTKHCAFCSRECYSTGMKGNISNYRMLFYCTFAAVSVWFGNMGDGNSALAPVRWSGGANMESPVGGGD